MSDAAKLIDIYEHLFAEPGWKELLADLTEKNDNIKTSIADSTMNFEQIQFYRGLRAGYRYLLELENTIEQIKHQQQGLPDVLE